MNTAFGTRPVPPEIWGGAIGFGSLIFVLDELRKYFRRNYKVQKRRKIIIPSHVSGIAEALQGSENEGDNNDSDEDDDSSVTETVEEK